MNGVQLSCECEYVDPMTLSPGDPLFAFITFAHRILIALPLLSHYIIV